MAAYEAKAVTAIALPYEHTPVSRRSNACALVQIFWRSQHSVSSRPNAWKEPIAPLRVNFGLKDQR
jgi:hypothetical protein